LTTSIKLAAGHSRQALFSATGDTVVLVLADEPTNGSLVAVQLVGGSSAVTTRTLAAGVLEASWFDGGKALLVKIGPSQSQYQLSLVQVDGSASQTLAKSACALWLDPAGETAYFARDCTPYSGELMRLTAGDPTPKLIAKNVYYHGFAISALDGTVVYLRDNRTDGNCAYTAVAEALRPDGATAVVSSWARPGSLSFTSTGTLLYQERGSCETEGENAATHLRALPAWGANSVPLATNRDYGFHDGSFDRLPYAISTDGKWLLAAELQFDGGGMPAKLYRIATDGSGEALVAQNLFNYIMISMAFEAFAFASHGDYVIYTHSTSAGAVPSSLGLGLSVVPAQGGDPVALAPLVTNGSASGPYFFLGSPTTDEVMFKTVDPATDVETIHLAQMSDGTTSTITSTTSTFSGEGFIAQSRRVIFVERSSGETSTLKWIDPGLGQARTLGSWTGYSPLHSRKYRGSYEIDPEGCVAIFNSTEGGQSTILAPLP
jgi:hypothetical protein